MSIQKKSLISTLKTAKKANVAKIDSETKGGKMVAPMGVAGISARTFKSAKAVQSKYVASGKNMGTLKVV